MCDVTLPHNRRISVFHSHHGNYEVKRAIKCPSPTSKAGNGTISEFTFNVSFRRYTAAQAAENQAQYSSHKKKQVRNNFHFGVQRCYNAISHYFYFIFHKISCLSENALVDALVVNNSVVYTSVHLCRVLTFCCQSRVSLPWVEEHPDVFNDAAFTITATHSLTPPTSPLTVLPVASHNNKIDQLCMEGKPISTLSVNNNIDTNLLLDGFLWFHLKRTTKEKSVMLRLNWFSFKHKVIGLY